MSLGTGALKVGREPERLRHSKEVSMATLRAGTTQNTQLSKVLGERRSPRTGAESVMIRSATGPQRSAQKCQREMQRKSQDKQKAPADTPQITYA